MKRAQRRYKKSEKGKECVRRYRKTEKGKEYIRRKARNRSKSGKLKESLRRSNKKQKEARIEGLGKHSIAAFQNASAADIGKQTSENYNCKSNLISILLAGMFGHSLLPFEAFDIVHTPLEEMGDLSPQDYAEKHGGVYIFYTEQQSAYGVGREAFRFITDGQKKNGMEDTMQSSCGIVEASSFPITSVHTTSDCTMDLKPFLLGIAGIWVSNTRF